MRPDVETATDRVAAARARLARTSEPDRLADQIEDALSEGYAQALAGDAWVSAAERHLHEMIGDPTIDLRGRDIRALVREHRDLQRRIVELRCELESLRREHDRMRTGSHAWP
ncbi:MAG: hypothetical protein ACLGI5_15580 [Thermoleophilia bacterium]